MAANGRTGLDTAPSCVSSACQIVYARAALQRGAHQVVQLLLQQEAGDGGLEVLGHALRGGVRAVGGAERVVHVQLRRRRQLLGELGVVALLLLVEAHVLEQQHAAVGRGGHRGRHLLADAVVLQNEKRMARVS